MNEFEEVTPRKHEEEKNELKENELAEYSEENRDDLAEEPQAEPIAEPAEEYEDAEEPEEPETIEEPEQEAHPQPSVREYHYEEKVKKAPKKKKGWSKFIVGCLIVSLGGGAGIGAGYGLVSHAFQGRTSVSAVPSNTKKTSSGDVYSAKEIVKAVKPSVVSVSTKISGTTQYFGAITVPYESQGAGSGVIFYSDDTRVAIATNNHVIENANSIYVTFEGDINVPAKVIGTKSESDLAVLTVSWEDLNKAGVEQVTTAVFGDSEALEVGEEVIAIGNAMGMGLSATDGIISMTGQTINVDGNSLNVLQTSAAINSGNSGGALVNSAGEVIGINTAKYNSSMVEGMGYAIPSNYIKPIVEELLETGTQPKPYIGITGTNITEETSPMYKLPVGALILEVTEGSPADKAGMQVGDVITKYNGKTVMDMDSLVEMVNASEIGKTVDVHVVRDGSQSIDLKVKISDKNS